MIEVEAKSLTTNKHNIASITDPIEVQAGLDGLLTINGVRVLVSRGNSVTRTVGYVYTEFARRVDRTGENFKFSRERRGIVEVDPLFKTVVKVTAARMEAYIREWFALCELVFATSGKVLVIVNQLPKMSVHLWMQDRFIAPVAGMFELIEP